jgi:hypothetical protein
MGLGIADQRLEVRERQRRARERQERRGHDLRHRREIGHDVAAPVLVQPFLQEGGGLHRQQGVTVGGGARDRLDAEDAAGARRFSTAQPLSERGG